MRIFQYFLRKYLRRILTHPVINKRVAPAVLVIFWPDLLLVTSGSNNFLALAVYLNISRSRPSIIHPFQGKNSKQGVLKERKKTWHSKFEKMKSYGFIVPGDYKRPGSNKVPSRTLAIQLKRIVSYVWPKKNILLQLDVLFCFLLLVAGRAGNLFIPIYSKLIGKRLW